MKNEASLHTIQNKNTSIYAYCQRSLTITIKAKFFIKKTLIVVMTLNLSKP